MNKAWNVIVAILWAIVIGGGVLALVAWARASSGDEWHEVYAPRTPAPVVETYPACVETADGNLVGIDVDTDWVMRQALCVWDNSVPADGAEPGYRLYTLVKGTVNGVGYGEDFPACGTELFQEAAIRSGIGCVSVADGVINGHPGRLFTVYRP